MVNDFDTVIRVTEGVLTYRFAGKGMRSTTVSLIGCLLWDLPLEQTENDNFGVEISQQYRAHQAVVRIDSVELRQLGQALGSAMSNHCGLSCLVQRYTPAQGLSTSIPTVIR